MSGMMSNAVGGPAAGVGGLSDISSLIEAWASSLWHLIDLTCVTLAVLRMMCFTDIQRWCVIAWWSFNVPHEQFFPNCGLRGSVCCVSLSGQQFAQQIQQQNPELIEQLRNHIRSRSFSGSAEEHSWSQQVWDATLMLLKQLYTCMKS